MFQKNGLTLLSFMTVFLLLFAVAVIILVLPEEGGIPYIDEKGERQLRDGTIELGSPGDIVGGELTTGWYRVTGTFVVSETLVINGDVRMILSKNCDMTVNGSADGAGIRVTGSNSLTIYAEPPGGAEIGKLTANAGAAVQESGPQRGCAGIGGGLGEPGGTITINGGVVTANGSSEAGGSSRGGAGIGGGCNGSGGIITINNGTVTASTLAGGAGIGGGLGGSGGTITINGGSIRSNGGIGGAGIGGGYGILGSGGDITVTGGSIQAYGGVNGAGIGGGGTGGMSGRIQITGGDVTAIGGEHSGIGGAGIGGGSNAGCDAGDYIFIYGDSTKVTVKGAATAFAVGGGSGDAGRIGQRDKVFVALPQGNLRAPGGAEIGNLVLFNADPATAAGTVKVTMPEPTKKEIELFTGLDQTGKNMSVITSVRDTLSILFELDEYSAVSIHGTGLMAAGAAIEFREFPYSYGISLDKSGTYSFAAVYGYMPPAPVAVKTTNTGTVPTGILTISLSGANASAFRTSATSLGSINVSGSSTFTVVPDTGLGAGTHTVTVTVGPSSGSVNPLLSQTFDIAFTVSKTGTSTALVSNGNPAPQGASVTLIATAASPNGTVPTGAVEFYDEAVLLGTATLNSSGTAMFPANTLGSGAHNITANYIGDADHNPSASAALVQTVSGESAEGRHYITATAENGTAVSPAGITQAGMGEDRTFTFSAAAGYTVSAVIVDGVPLSNEKVASGSYTFYGIQWNHTIDVKSSLVLTIVITGGEGYAEYSINGAPPQIYTSAVPLPNKCDLVLTARPGSGYEFKEWKLIMPSEMRIGDVVLTEEMSAFQSNDASKHLELRFVAETVDIGKTVQQAPPMLLMLLLMICVLLWFFVFRKKYYDVHIPELSEISGSDRVRKRSTYTFTVRGGYTGPVSYRAGEDGEWQQAFPDEGGVYTISGEEVADDLYLEKEPK